uniref:Keratin 98 n=1 Tax=Fundulus heteroclitus TaxID=8078 RepID=A0A3Q2Q6E1_FUNHE
MSFSSRSYSQRSVGQKTMSVYGGAGGHGTRISTPQIGYSSNAGGYNISDYHDLKVDANEKFALQNLNDRLASYLEKVHELEKENDRLEKQIKEWYTNKTVITHDYTAYFATIADLQDKIRAASTHNAKIYLEMDNSKLAAEDFKTKYENELSMRQAIEVDCAGLRKVLDELSLCRMDLESQYESLKDELVMMKKSHEEVKTQVGGQVKVEVDAPPPTDLQTVMTEIRDHYEGDIAKNRKELELWFLKQVRPTVTASRLEIKELKDNLQKLQIEYQSCCSMKSSLEATLHETQGQYAAQLAGLQDTVTGLEAHMSNLNATIKENKLKYDSLLDLKTRLEAEISFINSSCFSAVITKTIVVEETIVDGKVVTSTKSVDVDVNQIE